MTGVGASLAPIMLLLALGIGLQRFGFLEHPMREFLDRFVYWVALPALFLAELSSADLEDGGAGEVAMIVGATTIATMTIGYVCGFLLRLEQRSMGAFVQAAFRGNLAFVGLPVVLLSLDRADAYRARATAVSRCPNFRGRCRSGCTVRFSWWATLPPRSP